MRTLLVSHEHEALSFIATVIQNADAEPASTLFATLDDAPTVFDGSHPVLVIVDARQQLDGVLAFLDHVQRIQPTPRPVVLGLATPDHVPVLLQRDVHDLHTGDVTDAALHLRLKLALRMARRRLAAWEERSRVMAIANRLPGASLNLSTPPHQPATVRWASDGTGELLGVPDLVTQGSLTEVVSLIHHEDRRQFYSSWMTHRALEAAWEWEGRLAAGTSPRWIRATGRPVLLDDAHVQWDIQLMDITDRKRSERQLRAVNNALLESGASVEGNARHLLSVLCREPGVRRVVWTRPAQALVSVGAVKSHDISVIRGGEDQGSTGEPDVFRKRVGRHADSGTLLVFGTHDREATAPLMDLIRGALRAEARRLTAEGDRERATTLTRAMLVHSPFGLIVAQQDGTLEVVTERAIHLLHHDPTAVPSPETLADLPRILADAARHALRGESSALTATYLVDANETADVPWSLKPRDVYAFPVPDTPTRAAVLLTDVTQREQLVDKVRINSRMANVGMLSASIAHNLKTPIGTLRMNLDEVASAQDTLAPGAAEALDDAREAAKHLQDLIKPLNMYGREDADETEVLDINNVVSVHAMFARYKTDPLARLVHQPGDAPPVRGNATQLGQVVLNLIVNGAQAIEGRASENSVVVKTGALSNGDAFISVTDTGSGISPANRERIFQPLFSTKGASGGQGLGLHHCRQVVEDMGGTLSVESTLGKGSTFTVRLPACAPSDSHDTAASVDTPPPPSRPAAQTTISDLSLLIIDDMPRAGRALSRQLREATTYVASNGAEALGILNTHDIDVVLSDLIMPDPHGIELYGLICETHPRLRHRVLFLTGGGSTERETTFLASLRYPPIEKPFDVQDVIDAILLAHAARDDESASHS